MFKCEFVECNHREFDTTLGLSVHIKFSHHISKQEYAKKFKTKEWVECYICGKEFYKMINSQKRFDENGKCICACCGSCGQKLANIFSTITKTKNEMHKLIQIKAQKTKIVKGSNKIGARKAADKMIANGFYCSEKHKMENWIIAGQAAACKPEIRERAKKTIYKRFGKFTTWIPRFSLESQKLFRELEQKLNDIFGDIKVYYATKHHEYQIAQNRHHAFLDFYIPALNKIIEFDEEYHEKYGQKEKDIIRECLILSYFNNNVSILRVKKEDFIKDEQKVVEQCVSFLLDPMLSICVKRDDKTLFEILSIGCRK